MVCATRSLLDIAIGTNDNGLAQYSPSRLLLPHLCSAKAIQTAGNEGGAAFVVNLSFTIIVEISNFGVFHKLATEISM